MVKNPPDERVVYLALKNVFKGADTQIRNSKPIRKLVEKNRKHTDVQVLIQEHSIDSVCNVAKVLLEQQIFDSTLKAKIRFPEVFEVSPAQSAERVISEAEAAETEAEAIREIATGQLENQTVSQNDVRKANSKGKAKEGQISSTQPIQGCVPYTPVCIPQLYPVYLPFATQHKLLVKTQTLLEVACYNFASIRLREQLEAENWDCPEAVELNMWSGMFRSVPDKFAVDKLREVGKPLEDLLNATAKIRHTAVHRLRISASTVIQFMVDAESLAKLLEDDGCAMILSQLRKATQVTVDELKGNKDLLESTLAEKMKKFASQRAELERLEHEAVAHMLREDSQYQSYAGTNLEEAIAAAEKRLEEVEVREVGSTDTDTASEVELNEEACLD